MLVHFRSSFNATMIPFSAEGLWKDDSWWNSRKHEVVCLGYGCTCPLAGLCPTHSHGMSSNKSQTFEGLPVPANYEGQDVESCHSNECGLSTEEYCETTSSNSPSCRNQPNQLKLAYQSGHLLLPTSTPAPVIPLRPRVLAGTRVGVIGSPGLGSSGKPTRAHVAAALGLPLTMYQPCAPHLDAFEYQIMPDMCLPGCSGCEMHRSETWDACRAW